MKHTPSISRLHATFMLLLSATPAFSAGTEIFHDDFNSFSTSNWSVASWTTPHDRTQWGPTPLTPTISSGAATLKLNTYNPASPGTYLQGTEIVSKTLYSLNTGLEFEARVRTNTSTPGIITAFYLYGAHGTDLSDETDFEFATNDNANTSPDSAYLTNWNDWSSSSDPNNTAVHSSTHPAVPGLDVTTYNTFMIRWLPDRTEWYINNTLVRTTTQAVPNDPMNLIFNIWAPDSSWSSAYSSSLQPTATASANVTSTMDIDYALVRQIPANTWTRATSGTWSTSSNWNSPAPTGAGSSVNFLNIPNSPTTITLDSPKTVGSLTFDSLNSYTLTGSSLTLATSTGSSSLTVNSGSHTIQSPISLSSNTTLNIAASSSLTLTSPITGNVTLTKSTGTGTLSLPSFSLTSLTISAGTIQLTPNSPTTSKLSTLIASTGLLDLTNNTLAIDYTGASPASTIRIRLAQARTSAGNWLGTAGITSSTAAHDPNQITAIGYIESSQLPPQSASLLNNGTTPDSTTLFLKYTYYGDANLDGTINADDYALLDRGFRQHLTGWSNGDFNYDNTIDSNDYLLLDRAFALQSGSLSPSFLSERESEFGAPYVQELLTSLPEPSPLLTTIFSLLTFFSLNVRRSTLDVQRSLN
ncbi:MAG TPA: family 16 glycosylhydrolase [Tepidisphaeraceae bacterium]|nr:family 16 glycosylhydrolase [Tepidisphaeraceae bacterium]